MKNWMHLTLLIIGVVLAVAEAVALIRRGDGETVSEVIRDWNMQSGGLVALGILSLWWHWFGVNWWVK